MMTSKNFGKIIWGIEEGYSISPRAGDRYGKELKTTHGLGELVEKWSTTKSITHQSASNARCGREGAKHDGGISTLNASESTRRTPLIHE